MPKTNNHINYIEFKTSDLETTKSFYQKVFGWIFTDYGSTYTSFSEAGIDGGFEKTTSKISNGVLVVLHHNDLNTIKTKVIDAGGTISKDIFSFPGGCRFQFLDPTGNELAIWSED